MPLVLETERLRLRCFAREDLGQLYEIKSDPEVTRYMIVGRGRNEFETAEFIQSVMGREGFFKKHRFVKGQWQDSLYDAILEEEWPSA